MASCQATYNSLKLENIKLAYNQSYCVTINQKRNN